MSSSKFPPIDRLLRGVSTGHVETVRDAWREALADKSEALPAVLEKLKSPAWGENPRGPLAEYFGILLSLLDELDRPAFASEITRLKAVKLHPAHKRTLDLLSERLNDSPATRVGPNVPVYIASVLHNHADICASLETWSKTKGLSLEQVTRIDVIPLTPELDFVGLYRVNISGIVLVWPRQEDRNGLVSWFSRLYREFTFYHEVGHHLCGHLESSSIAEQEYEADKEGFRFMRRAHPIKMSLAIAVLWPIAQVLKAYKRLAK
ncbi:MAG: hypothetical protein AAFN44_05595 [Pseudomonadota bacterium]